MASPIIAIPKNNSDEIRICVEFKKTVKEFFLNIPSLNDSYFFTDISRELINSCKLVTSLGNSLRSILKLVYLDIRFLLT